jgi:hypothetical protein
MLTRQDIREESRRGKALRGAVVVLAAIALCLTGSRAWAALEDILYESGKITKEEWLKAKADREKEEAEREKQVKATMKGVVTHDKDKAKWVDSVIWSGDLRLRYEQFWRSQPDPTSGLGVERNRQRFRLRFGPEIKMGDFKATVQVGTSSSTDGINGDQVSHNQSFDNAFSQKEIFILRAYATWNPSFFKPMTIMAGKLKNPFYTQYTNDLLFDADVNPEGFAETFSWKLTDSVSVFTNFGQFVLDDDGGNHNQFMLGGQAGTELKIGADKLRVAVGFFDFRNLSANGLSEPTVQQFNSRAAAAPTNTTRYVNDYDGLHLTGQYDTELLGIPLQFLGDYLKNTTGVISCVNNAGNVPGQCGGTRIEGQDEGYQVGLRIGKASKANTWEMAYYYKWLQADATLSAFVDSDFGDGGTNRRGNIFWVGYNFTDFLNLKLKFFNTKPLVTAFCVGATSVPSCRDEINRMQIDAVFTF